MGEYPETPGITPARSVSYARRNFMSMTAPADCGTSIDRPEYRQPWGMLSLIRDIQCRRKFRSRTSRGWSARRLVRLRLDHRVARRSSTVLPMQRTTISSSTRTRFARGSGNPFRRHDRPWFPVAVAALGDELQLPAAQVREQTMGINYGFDKVRFMTPVKSGAQRARSLHHGRSPLPRRRHDHGHV